jgi:C-terminal processing protease CtpA/Prc
LVAASFGAGSPGSRATFVLDRGGRRIEATLMRDTLASPAPSLPDPVARLDDGIWYVDLERSNPAQIDSVIADLAAARAVIFDARGYPNGTHGVLANLSPDPLQSAIWRVPRTIRPDHEDPPDWDESGRWLLPPRAPRFAGRAVFLIGPGAISYAESVLGIVEHYRLGALVGEPTAGANGNVNEFTLPSGIIARWTGMRVVKHDGTEHHGIGIRPTVPVRPTIAGIRAGRDEVLEKGLEIARARPGPGRD